MGLETAAILVRLENWARLLIAGWPQPGIRFCSRSALVQCPGLLASVRLPGHPLFEKLSCFLNHLGSWLQIVEMPFKNWFIHEKNWAHITENIGSSDGFRAQRKLSMLSITPSLVSVFTCWHSSQASWVDGDNSFSLYVPSCSRQMGVKLSFASAV